MTLQMLMWVIAVVLAFVAAFWNPSPRPQLGWLAVGFLILGFIVGDIQITE
jgi:hypothetical protein